MTPTPQAAEKLQDRLAELRRVVVAFSGGVDSSVVAAAAHAADLDFALAVTANSPSVPRWQLDLAKQVAREIGIDHQLVATSEGARAEYQRNDTQRCFFCKETLYASLHRIAAEFGGCEDTMIVSGTNADDLGDHRPGIRAGQEAKVRTPLADLGFGKSIVRQLAAHYGLSNHDLPASPCLASRIAYGVEVTPTRLRQVEEAEDWLRSRGLVEFRVRVHADDLARIEVPRNLIASILELDQDGQLSSVFKRIGFSFVTIDLEGFQSGSLNRVLVQINNSSQHASLPMQVESPGTEVSR